MRDSMHHTPPSRLLLTAVVLYRLWSEVREHERGHATMASANRYDRLTAFTTLHWMGPLLQRTRAMDRDRRSRKT